MAAGSFALIELGYLLHLSGTLRGSLKDTMQFLERCFDAKPDNYSRTFQKMRMRKGDPAIFLVKGIDAIYKHMDILDDSGLSYFLLILTTIKVYLYRMQCHIHTVSMDLIWVWGLIVIHLS